MFFLESNKVVLKLSVLVVLFALLFFSTIRFLSLYILFEIVMVPLLIILLSYGSQIQKVRAAYYLILYSIASSIPFLFVYLIGEISILDIVYVGSVLHTSVYIILVCMFLIKFPVYFLHLWLPKVHVEAPSSASVLLASLVLKLGTFGLCRLLGVGA